MSIQVRHFVLTQDGIREIAPDQAARVAAGIGCVPELADSRVRYLQLTLKDDNDSEYAVEATGACIQFDDKGRLSGAAAPEKPEEHISRFEYDACLHWALSHLDEARSATFH